ncbi:MAG TPA: replicative DNA helicase [Candidatus Onthovivens sp.]|nr:replicative DNA helicase [Candidatus Onthovivens sp.]
MLKSYPFDEYAEKVVLGSMLLDSSCAAEGLTSLNEDDFFYGNYINRNIFRAMQILFDNDIAIDTTTLGSQLQDMKLLEEIGGHDYLFDLTNYVVSFVNFDHYVNLLHEKALLRKYLIELDRIEKEYETKEITDINAFINKAVFNLDKIISNRRVSDFVRGSDVAKTLGKQIESLTGGAAFTGLSTGFSELDTKLNGLGKGELIIIAARPSVGKSALALNMAYNAARHSKGSVAFFSLEMSNEMTMQRLFSAVSGVPNNNIQTGYLTKDDKLKLKSAENEISNVSFYMEENNKSSIEDIILKTKKLAETTNDLQLIVIDYIGIIDDGNKRYESEQVKIATFSRKLKQLAINLNIPIICVAQISRKADDRDSKKPQLSDLRQSGAIEQDADKVLLLYREGYYEAQGIEVKKRKTFKTAETSEETTPAKFDPSKPQIVEVIIAKNRQGSVGTVKLIFNGMYCQFNTPSHEFQAAIRDMDEFIED